MAVHPLIERSRQREVRQAKGFRVVAEALNGENLAADYRQELASAPSRSAAGKKHLARPNRRLLAEHRPGRESEHAAVALVNHRLHSERGLALPDELGDFEALAPNLVLKSAPAVRAEGAADPNYGIEKFDVAGIGPEGRLCLGMLRFTPPVAPRLGAGDTPLRALLEALAHAAVAEADRAALQAELAERSEREFADGPPLLLLIGSQRYWELSRKREAQKGAAWIRQMERLAREIEEALGITTLYLALRVNGDLGWNYEADGPVFEGEPRLLPAWEYGAGRIRQKAPARKSRKTAAEPEEIEADMERPVRDYNIGEHYDAGDRIQHVKLGLGVVQGPAGPEKIHVNFGEQKSVLVHDRAAKAEAS